MMKMTRNTIIRALVAATACLLATAAAAQEGQGPAMVGPRPAGPPCPASGYAPPIYGTFGVNGGGGQFAYELASPCSPKVVRDLTEAVGMGRDQPLGLKHVTTVIWSATGTMANAKGAMEKLEKLDVQMSYFIPAVRIASTIAGKTTTQVYADNKTWAEDGEGGPATPLPAAQGELLASLIRMTPFGGVWPAVEAEGHVKMTTVKDKTVLTATSPYDDKVEVTTTLMPPGKAVGLKPDLSVDIGALPETVSFKAGGHSYMATFSNYGFQWESDYRVIFPAKIKWTRDGKPLADLDVTYFHSNAYVIFPAPTAATQVAVSSGAMKRVSPSDAFFKQMAANDGPIPRTPDGHPDFTGIWQGGFPTPYGPYEIRHPGTLEPDQAAMQRSTHLNKPHYKPEFWSKVRSLDYSTVDVDNVFACGPPGVPRQMAPAKIMQNAKEALLYSGGSARFVPLDGRKHTDDDRDQATFDGIPSGHWEGDTLVIESVGFNDISWLMWQGYFHTDQMKVTERIWRKGNLMFYNATVDDPDVLAEPWTTDTVVRRAAADQTNRMNEPGECRETDLKNIYDLYNRG